MHNLHKRMVIGSMAAAGIVALMCLSDLVLGIPFSGRFTMVMDITFLIASLIVLYLGWETVKEIG